ncbi:phosphotransferase family protein [Hamadaea tsunoensis]|uniref:phosphotransferase family protein n=1 Tax=Hamadaea tsunoensis TaxID=53368 RepID=UPI0004030171|nr:phosphotransferase [Hamadaea tsunoensis]
MTLGTRIAHGREAEVYAWTGVPNAVVKLYRAGFTGGRAEVAALRGLAGSGVAPKLLDVVEVDGRTGLVLERLDGADLLSVLQHRPWRVGVLARELAGAALRLHRVAAPAELPDLKEMLAERIDAAGLDPALRDHTLRVLDGLPAGDRLCHGDLHPGNAVRTAAGVSIIDWPGASRGVPSADLARSLFLLRLADPLPDTAWTMRVIMATGRYAFAAAFARAYRRGAAQPLDRIDEWLLVHTAARLAEGVPAERDRLVAAVVAHAASPARAAGTTPQGARTNG